MKISFSAYEFHSDETFHKADYRYEGSCESGWEVYRNNVLYLSLGTGYVLLKSLYCGICSTDIARAKLPFPLPQITGHEVIALHNDKSVAVEINASHIARGLAKLDCFYCENDLGAHCPDRLTLGIDRLPGGFSPYLLAPIDAIFPLPEILPAKLATVIEPFSAALHAVDSSKLTNDMQVAIVGPRRLGLLLVLALNFYRNQNKLNFGITAAIRHESLRENCFSFGADEVLLTDNIGTRRFDMVYDTSGSASGFNLSMAISKKAVHVKSTHGLSVDGFDKLTQLVIDEISLSPLSETYLEYLSESMEGRINCHILIDKKIPKIIQSWIVKNYPENHFTYCHILETSGEEMKHLLPTDRFKKFDIILLSSLAQLNKVIDYSGLGNLVRAKGELFWFDGKNQAVGSWNDFFAKKIMLRTSRCGNFSEAIRLISENSAKFETVMSKYISGFDDIGNLKRAFKYAVTDSNKIKIVIKHE